MYDFGIWNLLIPEAERGGLMMMAHQDFGGGAQLFVEFAAQHNNSLAQGAPTPLDEGAGLTVPITNPAIRSRPPRRSASAAIAPSMRGRAWHI